MRKLKIAVIGSGISGLATSWKLSKSCDVELYEKNNYFGGHANTQIVKLRDEKQFYVDTGFIVFNEINYPNLCHLFRNLGVETYSSDMSFAASINDGNVEYSGSSLLNMFAQKKNIFNPKFLKMVYEIIKFYRTVEKDAKIYTEHTLKDYLEEKSYSEYFKYYHIFPMASSIWSSSINEISNFPFTQFVNFFSNHGLLNLVNRPKWRTVIEGSQTYVKKIIDSPNLKSFKNANVKVIKCNNNGVDLKINKKLKRFDHVVVAVHSDQVINLVSCLGDEQKKLFRKIKYSANKVYLHTDNQFMPKRKSVWASWNYIQGKEHKKKLSVTYWMNKLQKLDTRKNIFVTLNPEKPPLRSKLIKKILYKHPLFDLNTFKTQKRIKKIQGMKRIWFCGAYLGYGFHEDGIKSGLSVANKILEKKIWSK